MSPTQDGPSIKTFSSGYTSCVSARANCCVARYSKPRCTLRTISISAFRAPCTLSRSLTHEVYPSFITLVSKFFDDVAGAAAFNNVNQCYFAAPRFDFSAAHDLVFCVIATFNNHIWLQCVDECEWGIFVK